MRQNERARCAKSLNLCKKACQNTFVFIKVFDFDKFATRPIRLVKQPGVCTCLYSSILFACKLKLDDRPMIRRFRCSRCVRVCLTKGRTEEVRERFQEMCEIQDPKSYSCELPSMAS